MKKTLVLDLDETLVFSNLEHDPGVKHTLDIQGQRVFVRVRPGLHDFTERMRTRFDCRVWSTGQPVYVEAACHTLGLEWMTLWGRDRCRRLDAIPEQHHEPYDKPLSFLNVDMATAIIVDNAPGAFACNPSNGIPINTWRGDPNDRQLSLLGDYLEWLSTLPDLRRDHTRWATEILVTRNLIPKNQR